MAVLATAVWRVRPSGNNLNGGGYDAGIAGHATDYSQQNAAQAIGTNGTTSGAGSTTFTDATAGAFTALMIGNCIQIASGTNFQAGFYFVTAFTNANSVVLDRTPSSGGAGSAGVWKLGGGWADFWTNPASIGPCVPGNIVYILGSGTPNPAAYTYDYDATVNFTPFGSSTNLTTFANDPGTPGYKAPPDTTGGMPVIKFHVANSILSPSTSTTLLSGLWFVGTTTAASKYVISTSNYNHTIFGCVLDQFSFDCGLSTLGAVGGQEIIGTEIFSSVAPGSAGSAAGVNNGTANGMSAMITGCNFHDCVGLGITTSNVNQFLIVINSIIAKCQSDGIQINNFGGVLVQNCTIDGNLGHGINLATVNRASFSSIINNIISNQTVAGKSGINCSNATSPAAIDYNVYYNNTADLTNLNYGPHDTHGGANPYVGQATENYTLG